MWSGPRRGVSASICDRLRYLHVEGLVAGDLTAAVPSVAPSRTAASRALAPVVTRLLAGCDRRRVMGRRDYAVLMVLCRLGLRAGEVSSIELVDVNWRDGELLVRGKARRRDRMPLPVDVGEALAGYVQRGRPRVEGQRLFWRVTAPIGPLSSEAVSDIVRRARLRCGLPGGGAHARRHTPPPETVRAGGSLAEIGQLLRFRPRSRPRSRPCRPHGARGARTPVAGDAAVSALRQACEDYPALRRAAGFKLARHGRMLPDLVAYLEAAGLATLTTAATLEWATLPAGHPQEASRLSVARGFARYLRTLDPTAEVPPTDLLPGHRRRVAPHLYTDQIAALMAAIEDPLSTAGRDLPDANRAARRYRDAHR